MLWARIAPCCPLLEMFLMTMHSAKSVTAAQKTLTPYIRSFLRVSRVNFYGATTG